MAFCEGFRRYAWMHDTSSQGLRADIDRTGYPLLGLELIAAYRLGLAKNIEVCRCENSAVWEGCERDDAGAYNGSASLPVPPPFSPIPIRRRLLYKHPTPHRLRPIKHKLQSRQNRNHSFTTFLSTTSPSSPCTRHLVLSRRLQHWRWRVRGGKTQAVTKDTDGDEQTQRQQQ
jgi:hypothetical protein